MFLCFLAAHQTFLNRVFWFLHSINYSLHFFWYQLLNNFVLPSVSFTALVSKSVLLFSHLGRGRGESAFWSLSLVLMKKNLSVLDRVMTFSWAPSAPHILFNYVAEFMGLCFVLILPNQALCRKPPFCYLSALIQAQVCYFSQSWRIGFYVCLLVICKSCNWKHHREVSRVWGCVCVRTTGYWGCLGSAGGICRVRHPSSSWAGFLVESKMSLEDELSDMLHSIPGHCCPRHSLPSDSAVPHYSWWHEIEMGLLVMSHTTREARCFTHIISPFSWEKSGLRRLVLQWIVIFLPWWLRW